MRIPRIYRFVLQAFVAPFLASFSVALFILVLQFLAKYQDHIFGKGFSGWIIAQLFGYATIQMVIMALPIAILIASLITLGGLGQRNELAAIKSAGISLFRIIQPLIGVGVLLTLFSIYTAWALIPTANLQLYSLIYDIKKAKPALSLQQGRFQDNIEGYTIYFADRREKTGALLDIKLWQHDQQRGNFQTIYADSAHLKTNDSTLYMTLTLFSGEQHDLLKPDKDDKNRQPYARVFFDTAITRLDLSGFGLQRTEDKFFKSHRYMLTVPELAQAVDSLARHDDKTVKKIDQHVGGHLPLKSVLADSLLRPLAELRAPPDTAGPPADSLVQAVRRLAVLQRAQESLRDVNSYLDFSTKKWDDEREALQKTRTELHLKFALPLSCLVLLFIGAPLGAIIRKGGLGMPVVVAVGFFVLFYSMMTFGKKIVEEETVQAWFGSWLPVIVLFPMALYLTYQSSTDSRLFDLTAWRDLFRLRELRKKRPSHPTGDDGRVRSSAEEDTQ